MKPLLPLPSAPWKQRYEILRRHVLEERQTLAAAPLGLVLVFRQGVAGWMRGWGDGSVEQASFATLPPLPHTIIPLWQEQLTILLAQMAATFLES